MQRIREVERDMKYEEYAGREGDIVTGIIQQSDSRYTLLDLGRVEALLPQAEQVPYERPSPNTRLKAYIVEVRKTSKGPQIVVSRTHPGLIKRLFELEVPEIADGIVEIKACAREPGHRTKIAVWSNDANVDPVGACVGARGARSAWSSTSSGARRSTSSPSPRTPPDFVDKALSPAKVKEVRIDEDTGTAEVIVPDYQLAGHRQGGPERPPRRPAHRLAGRHQERDPARRGGGLQERGVGPGRVGHRPETRRAGVAAGRGRPAMSAEEWPGGADEPRRRRGEADERTTRSPAANDVTESADADVAEIEPEPSAEEAAMHVEDRRPGTARPEDDPRRRRTGTEPRRAPMRTRHRLPAGRRPRAGAGGAPT